MLGAAASSGATLLSITSFNEWGEGTQIEPSVDYGDGGPDLYLTITRRVGGAWRAGVVAAEGAGEL